MSGLFINRIQYPITFVTYRKDGLIAKQKTSLIQPGEVRLVDEKRENFDLDWYIILAFLEDANIPERIGVTQAVEGKGGGGSIGISVNGNGFSIGGSGSSTKTHFFSSGIAALCVEIGLSAWVLKEDSNNGDWWFERFNSKEAKWEISTLAEKAKGW